MPPLGGGRRPLVQVVEEPIKEEDTQENAPVCIHTPSGSKGLRLRQKTLAKLQSPQADSGSACTCFDWLSHYCMEASARYSQRRRPQRILLVRHGESLGNVDPTTYSRIPDNKVPLTDKGRGQARRVGQVLSELIAADESILALISPYQRTQETFEGIQAGLGERVKKVIHDPNLREQDFGNFQNPAEMNASILERQRFGRFFYRFPHGESGADVYSRAESFMSSLFRHMDNPNRVRTNNVLIVSHGIVMRMILMRFLRWTVEEYELVFNPDNCAIWMLTRDEHGEFSLAGGCEGDIISAPIAGIDGQRKELDLRMSRCHNRTTRTYSNEELDS